MTVFKISRQTGEITTQCGLHVVRYIEATLKNDQPTGYALRLSSPVCAGARGPVAGDRNL